MATNSLLHLVAASLWVGGLAALLCRGRRTPAHLRVATARFSRMALVCWLVTAASGVINAWVRVPLNGLFFWSIGFLALMCLLVFLQSTPALAWMVP